MLFVNNFVGLGNFGSCLRHLWSIQFTAFSFESPTCVFSYESYVITANSSGNTRNSKSTTKLIVTGATVLFVGTEVICLALRNKAVISVVALARSPVHAPKNAGADVDTSKLKLVVLKTSSQQHTPDCN